MILRDIIKIEKKRTDIKKQIYQRIFEQFTRKIKMSVELGQKQVFLQVPAFLFGFPTFDRAKATDYLKRQLDRSGFDVTKVDEYDLYVSWFKATSKPQKEPEESPELPNLANLRKLAIRYGSAPHSR
jgi:hypothetical protein